MGGCEAVVIIMGMFRFQVPLGMIMEREDGMES